MTKSTRHFEALDAPEPYDVCIVGPGIAGTVLALYLVRAGLKVLLIDAGAPAQASPSPREITGDTRYPTAAPKRWDGTCERLERSDFRAHPYDSRSNPWPIGYADLEPYYRRVEALFRVRGPSDSPHRILPVDDRVAGCKLETLIRLCGMDVRRVAAATPGAGRSFDPSRELLPEFIASRNGTLVTGVTAARLRTDANGRVIGAVCRKPDGSSKTARAQAYVLAAGPIETPRLLLLSRSQRSPRGLGNEHDRVGRGFSDQAIVTAYGRLALLSGWTMGTRPVHTEQFHRVFRRDGLGAIHPFIERLGPLAQTRFARGGFIQRFSAGVWAVRRVALGIACRIETMPGDHNRVTLSLAARDAFGDPVAHLDFNYSEKDLQLIAKVRAWLERWLDRFGATDTAQGEINWACNAGGTCRMGVDPSTSVCDANLRVHTTPNLYICGAAALPRSGALPTALTVAALACRLADHIAARTRWCARASARPKRASSTHSIAVPIPLVRRRPQP